MELNDLVKAIEEKFGVSAAAMATPAAEVAAVLPLPVAEEKTEFTVQLTGSRRQQGGRSSRRSRADRPRPEGSQEDLV